MRTSRWATCTGLRAVGAATPSPDDGIVGIDRPWVYPQLALLPMLLAQGLEWIAGYEVAWALLVTGLDAIAFALLIGRGRSAGRRQAPLLARLSSRCSDPIAMYRIDAVTVPLAVAGCLWLVGRPWIASAPRGRDLDQGLAGCPPRRRCDRGAPSPYDHRRRAASSPPLPSWRSSPWAAARTCSASSPDQTERGLQLEAPVSAFYLWRAVAGIEGSFVYYDRDLLTFQVAGPAVDAVIAVMTPLLVVAVAGDRGARCVQGVARSELRRPVPAARAEPRARAHRRQQGRLAAVPHLAHRSHRHRPGASTGVGGGRSRRRRSARRCSPSSCTR